VFKRIKIFWKQLFGMEWKEKKEDKIKRPSSPPTLKECEDSLKLYISRFHEFTQLENNLTQVKDTLLKFFEWRTLHVIIDDQLYEFKRYDNVNEFTFTSNKFHGIPPKNPNEKIVALVKKFIELDTTLKEFPSVDLCKNHAVQNFLLHFNNEVNFDSVNYFMDGILYKLELSYKHELYGSNIKYKIEVVENILTQNTSEK